MTWGIRAVIRPSDGTVNDLGELMLRGQPFGYSTREMCVEAIEMLENGLLLDLRGVLEPFETGREIQFADTAKVGPAVRTDFSLEKPSPTETE
jgi:hypothetical protein